MFKKILALVAATMIFASAQAQDVELRDDHPDRHVVVKGDTLWDIAGRFLKSPWQWPEIWQANPQIENPHLIYPGDVISLIYVGGKPQLVVNREEERPTVKLSPGIRVEDLNDAIPTISLDRILPFLKRTRMMDEEEALTAPYVVSVEEGGLRAAPGFLIYARGIEAKKGDLVAIARPTNFYIDKPYRDKDGTRHRVILSDPWDRKEGVGFGDMFQPMWQSINRYYYDRIEDVGYEAVQIGLARMLQPGDPAKLVLLSAQQDVMAGDLALATMDPGFDPYFTPRAPRELPEGTRIVALNTANLVQGAGQVVAITAGSESGIEPGHVMAVYRPPNVIKDEVKYPKGTWDRVFNPSNADVELPAEYVGIIMVFRSYQGISYALGLESVRSLKVDDEVHLP